MFPRPDNQASWNYSRRKLLSLLSLRNWPSFGHVFVLGLFCGLLLFGRNRTFTEQHRPVTDSVTTTLLPVTNATAPTPTQAATPVLAEVGDNKQHAAATLTINGVQHPFPKAALAWAELAENVSRTPQTARNDSLPPLALFILVKSAPAYLERRKLCRLHWQWRSAAGQTHIKGLVSQQFLIGRQDKITNEAVLAESKEHGDIVIYPGNDTYRRLPWKVLWGLKYVTEHFKFDMLLLMDDDSFVNYPMTLRWVASQLAENIYAGQLVDMHPKVQRKEKDQWYVPRSVYAPDEYPPYHWGAGYFMSSDLVLSILHESTHHDILWIDDAFMAILLNSTGLPIKIQDIRVYAVPDWKIFLCCEPSPLVLGSRNPKKMSRLGTMQKTMAPLCRSRRSKACKRRESP